MDVVEERVELEIAGRAIEREHGVGQPVTRIEIGLARLLQPRRAMPAREADEAALGETVGDARLGHEDIDPEPTLRL